MTNIHSHDSYSHRNNSYSHHKQNNTNHVDGYNPRTEGYDPKKFRLPSENFTPMPLPHVDHVEIGVHRGWDPSLVRPTFGK